MVPMVVAIVVDHLWVKKFREPLIKVFLRDDRVEPVIILRASSPCPHEKSDASLRH